MAGMRVRLELRDGLADLRRTLPRYLAVGGGSALLGTAALWYLTAGLHLYYLAAASLVGLGAVVSDFALHSAWTFARRQQALAGLPRRLVKYLTSKAVGFAVSFVVLAFCTQVVGLHYLLSNLCAVGAAFVWNYAASAQWVWARK